MFVFWCNWGMFQHSLGNFLDIWNSKQPVLNRCLVKTTISHVTIWNHPIETTIWKWMFQVPGRNIESFHQTFLCKKFVKKTTLLQKFTLPKTNSSPPENPCLVQMTFPFQMVPDLGGHFEFFEV